MPELSVIIISQDDELRTVLQMLVDSSTMARTVHSASTLPMSGNDPVARRVRDASPDVILIDIPVTNPGPSLRSLELLHGELPAVNIFGIGELSQPQVIVNAMRAGAREFLERPPTPTALLEAFVRVASAQRKTLKNAERGRIFTVLNAKGGCGATTIAVNLALCMQAEKGQTALLDLAQLGHCALHLNAKPNFSVGDVLKNLHRLDSSLLESFMTRHSSGLHLLAGASEPVLVQPQPGDFARMFDLLVQHYKTIVVDASTRLDPTTRILGDLSDAVLVVAHADVPSLWSASRIAQFVWWQQSRAGTSGVEPFPQDPRIQG